MLQEISSDHRSPPDHDGYPDHPGQPSHLGQHGHHDRPDHPADQVYLPGKLLVDSLGTTCYDLFTDEVNEVSGWRSSTRPGRSSGYAKMPVLQPELMGKEWR